MVKCVLDFGIAKMKTSVALRASIIAICCGVLFTGASEARSRAAHKPNYNQPYANKPIVERMVGIWVMTTDPNRVLTITRDLRFRDSKITGGTLQPNGQPGLYTFLYEGQPKCRVFFVPIGRNRLLLNDDHVRNSACILGLLNRVS